MVKIFLEMYIIVRNFKIVNFVKSIIFDVTLCFCFIYIRTYILKGFYDIYRISINDCCS